MIHPHTELRTVNQEIGLGVFATAFIPKGTITWTLCQFDQAFSAEAVRAFAPGYRKILEKYSYINAQGDYILCWDAGRYVNHSCEPTSLSIGTDVDIAIRDIQAGEQLTCEYGTLNITQDLVCTCGVDGCRGRITATDVLNYGDSWDAIAQDAFMSFPHVEQPLWQFVQNQPLIQALLDGVLEFPSHRVNYIHHHSSPQHSDKIKNQFSDQSNQTQSSGLWAISPHAL